MDLRTQKDSQPARVTIIIECIYILLLLLLLLFFKLPVHYKQMGRLERNLATLGNRLEHYRMPQHGSLK